MAFQRTNLIQNHSFYFALHDYVARIFFVGILVQPEMIRIKSLPATSRLS